MTNELILATVLLLVVAASLIIIGTQSMEIEALEEQADHLLTLLEAQRLSLTEDQKTEINHLTQEKFNYEKN